VNRIAGARLAARPAWPVRTMAERLADTRHRLDELRAGDLDVRTSLLVGHGLLTAGSPAERAAAAAFGLLGLPDATDLSPPFAERLLGAADPVPVLELLVDAQLLDSRVPGRYRLHDLLRLLARELAAAAWSPGELAAALTRAMRWQVATAWQAYAVLRPGDPRLSTAGGWAEGGTPLGSVPAALDWLESEPSTTAGVEELWSPVWNDHRTAPLAASSAYSRWFSDAANTLPSATVGEE
jgi:hypothetical protein